MPSSGVGEVYSKAEAFIFPTLSDGIALTQLEASAHGLPVIASRYCGDAVTEGVNGWILDDLAPVTLASVIRRAMKEAPEFRRTPLLRPKFSSKDLAKILIGMEGRSAGCWKQANVERRLSLCCSGCRL